MPEYERSCMLPFARRSTLRTLAIDDWSTPICPATPSEQTTMAP